MWLDHAEDGEGETEADESEPTLFFRLPKSVLVA